MHDSLRSLSCLWEVVVPYVENSHCQSRSIERAVQDGAGPSFFFQGHFVRPNQIILVDLWSFICGITVRQFAESKPYTKPIHLTEWHPRLAYTGLCVWSVLEQARLCCRSMASTLPRASPTRVCVHPCFLPCWLMVPDVGMLRSTFCLVIDTA